MKYGFETGIAQRSLEDIAALEAAYETGEALGLPARCLH